MGMNNKNIGKVVKRGTILNDKAIALNLIAEREKNKKRDVKEKGPRGSSYFNKKNKPS